MHAKHRDLDREFGDQHMGRNKMKDNILVFSHNMEEQTRTLCNIR